MSDATLAACVVLCVFVVLLGLPPTLHPRTPLPRPSFYRSTSFSLGMPRDNTAVQCFNGAIEACALADDIDGGMSLLAEMGRAGIVPNGVSFRSLVSACKRKDKPDLKKDLREAMSRLGLKP